MIQTNQNDKKSKPKDISVALRAIKQLCVVDILLYLVAVYYSHVSGLIPREEGFKELFFNYFMGLGYLLMILGLINFLLKPDSVSKWYAKILKVDWADSTDGKLAECCILSYMCLAVAPVIAFMAFISTGALIHLHISVPLFVILTFWMINRAENSMTPDIPDQS